VGIGEKKSSPVIMKTTFTSFLPREKDNCAENLSWRKSLPLVSEIDRIFVPLKPVSPERATYRNDVQSRFEIRKKIILGGVMRK
jgi:hypothetical protein